MTRAHNLMNATLATVGKAKKVPYALKENSMLTMRFAAIYLLILGIGLQPGIAAGQSTLEERLQAPGYMIDTDLLKGLRLPHGESAINALGDVAAKDGMIACHKSLYPNRKEMWPVSADFKVKGDEARTYCLGTYQALSTLSDYTRRTQMGQ